MGSTLPVLIADASVLNLRFLRETMNGFLHGEIDTSSNAEYAFELALKKSYGLYLFNLGLPVLPGALLYDLLRRVSKGVSGASQVAPVLFIADDRSVAPARIAELIREPGVRGVLRAPFRIQRLIDQVTSCVDGVYLKPHVWAPTPVLSGREAA